jgi:hypothetical protein
VILTEADLVREEMPMSTLSRARRAVFFLVVVLGIAACAPTASVRSGDLELVSRTRVAGTVNGAAVVGAVTSTIQTGRGGRSSCEYSQLPGGFNPGTLNTHA